MNTKKINRNSPIPLYSQLHKILEDKILEGILKDGDKIPSEKELSDMYKVSRATVRNALNLLSEDHLIYSVAGIGSFVKYPILGNSLVRIVPFSETLESLGKNGFTKIIENSYCKKEPVGFSKLKKGEHELIGKLDLVGYLEDKPIVYYTSYIAKDIFDSFSDIALELENQRIPFSTFDLYKQIGYSYSNISQKIYVVPSNELISKLLCINLNSPILVLESIFYDSNNVPIEYKKGHYRGDKYVFELNRNF